MDWFLYDNGLRHERVKQKIIMKCLAIMRFFTTRNSKNVVATLRIVTTGRSESTFLLILYFHAQIFGPKYETLSLPLKTEVTFGIANSELIL